MTQQSHPINFVLHNARTQARREALLEAAAALRSAIRFGGLPADAEPEYVVEGIAQFLEDLAAEGRAVEPSTDLETRASMVHNGVHEL